MKITFLENAEEIRRNFIDRYVMSWDEFQNKDKDSANHLGIDWFEKAYLWDRFYLGVPIIAFPSALSALREHSGDVMIMSEDNIHHPGELFYDNKKYINFVAKVNAKELANLIEKEWINWNLYDEKSPPALPEDLYVFDKSMKWFIAFTHETAYITPGKNSRHCYLYTQDYNNLAKSEA